MLVELKVNGRKHKIDIEPDEFLVDTLKKSWKLKCKKRL